VDASFAARAGAQRCRRSRSSNSADFGLAAPLLLRRARAALGSCAARRACAACGSGGAVRVPLSLRALALVNHFGGCGSGAAAALLQRRRRRQRTCWLVPLHRAGGWRRRPSDLSRMNHISAWSILPRSAQAGRRGSTLHRFQACRCLPLRVVEGLFTRVAAGRVLERMFDGWWRCRTNAPRGFLSAT